MTEALELSALSRRKHAGTQPAAIRPHQLHNVPRPDGYRRAEKQGMRAFGDEEQ
jgi:hypothetical protein